ncbi:MAG TPA: glycosyltransferase family 1 protein [Chitinophagaceae bacterium]|nr:glycosyltransferase family 1 protein [Chitinophagaceae bacterium]
MRIAVNTRFLLKDYLEGYGYFLYETFRRITEKYPEHEFIFLFDRPFDPRFVFQKNVTPVVAGPAARHPILWKFWYDVKVPSLLKKYKADVFVSCDGFCSLNTSLPQCLVVHDLAFLHYPEAIKKSHLLFYKKYTPKFLNKAKSVVTVSDFSKNDIIRQYGMISKQVDVVYSAAKEIFHPLTDAEKQEVKNKYTDGKEYFVYTGSIHPRKNLVNLLKAFSVFKKRQQSGMKLVLAGRLAWKYEIFIDNLKSYKYRDDVVVTGYLPEAELVGITGAAYAMVYASLFEGFGVPVLEAMKCQVPVITSAGSAMQEMSKDAALYANANSYTDIADKMMLLYKDENLRSELIGKSKTIADEYSWERTAALLWQAIQKAVG